jgi:ABC-type nitrate/sulfonate/bicarbonate transport system ATPase subunit
VRGLRHSFGGVPVVDDVSFDVAVGGFTAILGPSGGGKSTVLRALAGLLVPESGVVEVAGENVVGQVGRVAFMPQRDQLLPWKRVVHNAVLGAVIRGRGKDEAMREALAMLGRFGLGGYERAWPSQLSGGMRQRLALLRTMLVGLDVLVLDEPFGALDAITRRELHQWLQGVLDAERRSTVLVTHDVEEALLLADHVVVLSARPATVVTQIAVPFTRPRASGIVTDPEFVRFKARLLAALDA